MTKTGAFNAVRGSEFPITSYVLQGMLQSDGNTVGVENVSKSNLDENTLVAKVLWKDRRFDATERRELLLMPFPHVGLPARLLAVRYLASAYSTKKRYVHNGDTPETTRDFILAAGTMLFLYNDNLMVRMNRVRDSWSLRINNFSSPTRVEESIAYYTYNIEPAPYCGSADILSYFSLDSQGYRFETAYNGFGYFYDEEAGVVKYRHQARSTEGRYNITRPVVTTSSLVNALVMSSRMLVLDQTGACICAFGSHEVDYRERQY